MSFDPNHPGTVILRDSPPHGESHWLLFSHPVQTLTADTPAEVVPLLHRIEEATARGIVDMLRNDLGRIARPGSVTVPRRFMAVEHARRTHGIDHCQPGAAS